MIIHNPILTGSLVFNGTNLTTSNLVTTGSNNFTGSQSISGSLNVTGNITATTLVVQTVSSSVVYSSGSNVFGNNIANTQVMTGSFTVTGSLAVITNGTELQVTSTGVKLGNIITDSHPITGSVNVSGSATFLTSVTAGARIQAQGSNGAGTSQGGFLINYNANTNSRSWLINNDYNTFGDFAILQTTTQTGSTFTAPFYIALSGYVGIGTLSPSSKVTIIRDSPFNTGDQGLRIKATDADGYNLWMGASTNGYATIQSYRDNVGGATLLLNPLNGGAVCINTTTQDSGAVLTISQGTSVGTSYVSTGTGTTGVIYFKNGNGVVGQIYTNGSTTTYATNSDYRLKEDLKDFNGLNLISAIKIYDYEWKFDKTRAFGVIAHELQETIPYAVNGEKDGEQMQGVDYSKIVPVLVKAIQELKAEIEILKTK